MVFDAHSDIWTDVTVRRMRGEKDVFCNHHLARLKKGGVEGGIFAIWVDPPHDADHAARTRQMMDCIREEIAESTGFRIVHTYEEMLKARLEGVFYVYIGVEGMACAGEDPAWLDTYYDLGARHAMLTWNEANALGAGAMSGEDYGLTELGKQTVRRLQKKGMLLDVSHLNEAGFWDVAKLTEGPFVASHSNCRALCDVPRNLTDGQLRAIRDAGGVVGVNVCHDFVHADPARQTAETLALHAAHMIEVMGIDHVGCGFDFCEFLEGEEDEPRTPGLEDAARIPNFFECLKRLGLNREELEKVARGNFLRVLRRCVG
ncbi:dipeptidase [uncultured Oscillibacter sp.]|uniref:dipeptidase n=1 Tax=uncultured Oscillibacter sp. TaxID=876091 RepID=UPI0025CBDCEB|nr:dipeptidase [uncultured Oscillibacter sp.]